MDGRVMELMIYLNKILPHLLYPSTIILALMIWAIVSKKRTPLVIALLIFWTASTPYVSKLAFVFLEEGQPRKLLHQINSADVVVVLSGMLTTVNSANGPMYEWGDPDRYFAGIELIKEGKGKYLLFTSGRLPWDRMSQSEGEYLAQFAIASGIAAKQVKVTLDVQNTAQEASEVKSFLNKNKLETIILVTSNFHTQRAKKLFEDAGISTQTFPVDSKVNFAKITPMDFLPNADAFAANQFFLREMIGRLYYRIKLTLPMSMKSNVLKHLFT